MVGERMWLSWWWWGGGCCPLTCEQDTQHAQRSTFFNTLQDFGYIFSSLINAITTKGRISCVWFVFNFVFNTPPPYSTYRMIVQLLYVDKLRAIVTKYTCKVNTYIKIAYIKKRENGLE